MDKNEAKRIVERFFRNDNPTKDDEFVFTEACHYLIEVENDRDTMVNLGGYYYDKEKYNLAEKYYLMAYEAGDDWVADGLGFIYYYGRTGERDYEKAFFYFSKAKENGNLEAAMKIADMYRNGYGVPKDKEKYKALLLEVYEKVKDTVQLFDPLPEVSHRLAAILIEEGHPQEAIPLLQKGKNYITQRIRYNAFWGNFIVCRRTIELLYSLIELDEESFDFFDLFYVLKTPCKVKLFYMGNVHEIESYIEEDELRVRCDTKHYKSIENFLINATFDGKHTYIIDFEDFYRMRKEP